MDFIQLIQIVGRVEEENLQLVFPFAYSVSFLDPESSVRAGRPSFLEAPGQIVACGVPVSLSCWGRRVERLAAPRGTSAAPRSPRCCICVSAQCGRCSPAVQQSSRLEESLCAGGPGRVLWVCSGPALGRGSEGHKKHLACSSGKELWSSSCVAVLSESTLGDCEHHEGV